MSARDFSMSGEVPIPLRRIDNDAPPQLRIELLSSVFSLADDGMGPSERTLYSAVIGTLGILGAVQPYGGLVRRASENLCEAPWPRVFDVILRLVPEFQRPGRLDEYRRTVNGIFAAHGVIWDLDGSGRLIRVLPEDAERQVTSSIQELGDPQFQAARELLRAGQEAFNSVPRRDRDACASAFDAMESVGRTRFGGATTGDGKPRILLVVCKAGWGLALDMDTCVQILDECGSLPTGPVGLVSLIGIPEDLDAGQAERFLRENGAVLEAQTR